MISQDWLKSLANCHSDGGRLVSAENHPPPRSEDLLPFFETVARSLEKACETLNLWAKKDRAYHYLRSQGFEDRLTLLVGKVQLALCLDGRWIRCQLTTVDRFVPESRDLGAFELKTCGLGELMAYGSQPSPMSSDEVVKWALEAATTAFLDSRPDRNI